jgi:hypothetical protein
MESKQTEKKSGCGCGKSNETPPKVKWVALKDLKEKVSKNKKAKTPLFL